jgi:hypothetical protein
MGMAAVSRRRGERRSYNQELQCKVAGMDGSRDGGLHKKIELAVDD